MRNADSFPILHFHEIFLIFSGFHPPTMLHMDWHLHGFGTAPLQGISQDLGCHFSCCVTLIANLFIRYAINK